MDLDQHNQIAGDPLFTTSELTSPLDNSQVFKSSSKKKYLVLFLVLLILGLLTLLVYLFYQNTRLKRQVGLIKLDKPTIATCEHNGTTYVVGESFTDSDGCNSCSCSETGEVACTLMVCEKNSEQSYLDFNQSDWKTYTDPLNKYTFTHPSNYFSGQIIEYKYEPDIMIGSGVFEAEGVYDPLFFVVSAICDDSILELVGPEFYPVYKARMEDCRSKLVNPKDFATTLYDSYPSTDSFETDRNSPKEVSDIDINGVEAYQFSQTSSTIISPIGEYALSTEKDLQLISFAHKGTFYFIAHVDSPLSNQILSTFKFTE